jgi:hypothetical protein
LKLGAGNKSHCGLEIIQKFSLPFKSQNDDSGSDHEYAQPLSCNWALAKKNKRKNRDKNNLVYRRDLRGFTDLQRAKVTNP